MNPLRAVWKRLATLAWAHAGDSRHEYMTRMTYAIGLPVVLLLIPIVLVLWPLGTVQDYEVILVFSLNALMIVGAWLTWRGQWQWSRYIPVVMIYGAGVAYYLNGNAITAGLLPHLVVITLAALLFEDYAQWVALVLAIAATLLLGWPRDPRSFDSLFSATFSMVASLVGITWLQWLAIRQLRHALARAQQSEAALRAAEQERQRAQVAHDQSERLYRTVVDSVEDVIHVKDRQARYILVNEGMLRGWHTNKEHLLGKTAAEFYPGETGRQIMADDLRVLETGAMVETEEEHHPPEGGTTYSHVRKVPLRDESGAVTGIVTVSRNITERKKAEQALRESEATLRSIFLAAPIGIGLVTQRVLGWSNEQLSRITGYTAEELYGQSTRLLYPNDEEYERVGREKYPQVEHFGVGSIETRFRRKDGAILEVLLSSSAIVPGHAGQGLVFTVLDITERKLMERQLAASRERLQLALDSSSEGLFDWDIPSGDAYFSPRWYTMLDYDPDEFPATFENWTRLIHPDDLARTLKATDDALKSHLPGWSLDFRLRTKSGGWRIIHTNGHVVDWDSEGNAVRLVGTHTDVTELRRTEEQLRQAMKMEAIGRLAGGVAHDFNNLLTVINGYSEMLLNAPDLHDALRADLHQIQRAGGRAAALTRQLLAFSRKQILEPRILDLNDLIAGTAKMMDRLLGEDVHLVLQMGPQVGQVRADAGQLEQVLMNLAANARDAMPQGGTLTLHTDNVELGKEKLRERPEVRPGPYVMLAVSDSGAGMSAEVQRHIFEPFFTTKGVGAGTGLGLATVYGIVAQSEGHITVESAPGQGTTFRIYLPRVAEEAASSASASDNLPQGHETVLVVEDQAEVRQIALRMLRSLGYTVQEAASGAEALALLEHLVQPVDLVMTDVVMPEMSGKDLADALRRRQPQCRVLYMSGYTDDAIVRHGITEEGQQILQKPFTKPELARHVRAVLDGTA